MRKMKRISAGLFAMMMAVSMTATIPATNVEAAKKKLTANRVYEQSTKIKGKTKKKYTVKVKINGKTYRAKANKKGNFTIKVPKVKVGKKYTLKAYKGKKYYTKKTVYVIAKKVKVNTFKPSDKTITGYTRPSYKVKLTINGKTYTVKANKTSGKFTVKLSKPAGSGNATVKVYNTKGKSFTSATKAHTHDWKQQYKTVKHEEVGHYETVTVPAWDETKTVGHDTCLKDGFDLTQGYLDSVKNKTYPKPLDKDHLYSWGYLDQETLDNWGYTEENGYPKTGYDANIFTSHGLEIDKFAPPYSMYMGLARWNEECDGHNYGSKYIDIKIHHPATTKQQWVVDQKAYTEKVPNGFKCACGVTKK